MKKTNLFIVIFLCLHSFVFAQTVDVAYENVKLKLNYSPVSPLPSESTFEIELPKTLTYNTTPGEVRYIWNPFGLVLDIKWETKLPSTYLFKFNVAGVQNMRQKTIRRGEGYVIEWTYNLPAQIDIYHNQSGEKIRTVIINDEKQEFKTIFHRNYFNKNNVGLPMFKEELEFSYQDLKIDELKLKYAPDNTYNLNLVEKVAVEEVFEEIKRKLVVLYGSKVFRSKLTVIKLKDTKSSDLAEVREVISKFEAACNLFATNSNQPDSYMPSLQEAKIALTKQLENPQWQTRDFIPYCLALNLAVLTTITEKFSESVEYQKKANTFKRPKYNSYYDSQTELEEFRNYLLSRKEFSN